MTSPNDTCRHPDPSLCAALGRHIHGRRWEIWTGAFSSHALSEAKCETYRRAWCRAAGVDLEAIRYNGTPPAPSPPQPECRHRGGVVRQAEQRGCGCSDPTVDVFACDVHGECTRNHAPNIVAPGTSTRLPALPSCSTCDEFSERPPRPRFDPGPACRGFMVTADGRPADALWATYRGASCFLCCGGPSLGEMPLELLEQRGVLTAAVNQCGATHVRPDLWFCVDTPASFHPAIWSDAGIQKFVFRSQSRSRPRTWNGQRWVPERLLARQHPNVWFYEHSFGFNPATFLTQSRPTWGGEWEMARGLFRRTKSVMLPALRILYWLGIRTVYLCGADFHMQPNRSYAFDEPKDRRAAGTNNNTYSILGHWFRALKPHFEKAGFTVYNCTRGSRLEAFERKDFRAAITEATREVPDVDRVRGLYTT